VQSGRDPSSGSRVSGFRKKRAQGLGASTHEVAKCREPRFVRTRGTSIRWGPRGRRVDTHRLGRSQHSVDFSRLGGSRDRSTKARRPNSRGGEMREVRKGSQTIANFHISEVREVGARRLDAPTREVARCEKCEKEVKPSLTFASRRFAR
jgi:hypothetical protein